MSLVLAFSRRPDASLRDIVRTGAVDLLQLPIDDKELAQILACVTDLLRLRQLHVRDEADRHLAVVRNVRETLHRRAGIERDVRRAGFHDGEDADDRGDHAEFA